MCTNEIAKLSKSFENVNTNSSLATRIVFSVMFVGLNDGESYFLNLFFHWAILCGAASNFTRAINPWLAVRGRGPMWLLMVSEFDQINNSIWANPCFFWWFKGNRNKTIFNQCSISIPPENIRKHILVENVLINLLKFAYC